MDLRRLVLVGMVGCSVHHGGYATPEVLPPWVQLQSTPTAWTYACRFGAFVLPMGRTPRSEAYDTPGAIRFEYHFIDHRWGPVTRHCEYVAAYGTVRALPPADGQAPTGWDRVAGWPDPVRPIGWGDPASSDMELFCGDLGSGGCGSLVAYPRADSWWGVPIEGARLRFRGGLEEITFHSGDPDRLLHAVTLELGPPEVDDDGWGWHEGFVHIRLDPSRATMVLWVEEAR